MNYVEIAKHLLEEKPEVMEVLIQEAIIDGDLLQCEKCLEWEYYTELTSSGEDAPHLCQHCL